MKNNDEELVRFKEVQRKKAYSTNAGSYIPHVYHVFNDPDFRQDLRLLREKVEALYAVEGWSATEEAIDSTLATAIRLVRQVADKYRISIGDLTLCADGSFDVGGDYGEEDVDYGGITLAHYDPEYDDGPRICYEIGPKTTLKQIKRDWELVKAIQTTWLDKKRTKIKSPDEPLLVYSIFKALSTGLSFSDVFGLYQSGKLKGYENKVTNQFNSADSLARYYRKYAPKEHSRNNTEHPNLPMYVKHVEY